jgi:hypothetical protein
VNLYPFIEARSTEAQPLNGGAVLLEVSGPPPRAHAATPSAHLRTDTEHIGQVHQVSKGRYGAPCIHAELL